ncbi:hypothetical protein FOXYSP1_04545, partial [Fusarium oxysporum f. sp. phaseoli]
FELKFKGNLIEFAVFKAIPASIDTTGHHNTRRLIVVRLHAEVEGFTCITVTLGRELGTRCSPTVEGVMRPSTGSMFVTYFCINTSIPWKSPCYGKPVAAKA